MEQIEINQSASTEHRRASRTDVSLIARVRPLRSTMEIASRVPATGVAVTDISLLGLSYMSNHHVSVGDLVEIDLSWRGVDTYFHGTVRHVEFRSGLYCVGIQYVVTPSTKQSLATLREWLDVIASSSPQ